jgi:glycosyltransferase involved in cell wall biosynthesis
MPETALIIPAYNEERRLPVGQFQEFARRNGDVRILFVDDGSRDGTPAALESVRSSAPERVSVVRLPRNAGKAEAVRQGFLRALDSDAEFIGFWDADLATPLHALPSFLAVMRDRPKVAMVLGSRVKLMGREIVRSPLRHYPGRVIATLISLLLNLPVYDTQCGAKLFRRGKALPALFAEPFRTKWVFDVEILARYLCATAESGLSPEETIYELPLETWRDPGRSKVMPWHFAGALWDLGLIYARYPGCRRRPAPDAQ